MDKPTRRCTGCSDSGGCDVPRHDRRTLTLGQWQSEAIDLFGKDPTKWRFVCPSCGMVQTKADFIMAGFSPQAADLTAAYSCLRRWTDEGCLAAGTGPVTLIITEGEERPTFEFDK